MKARHLSKVMTVVVTKEQKACAADEAAAAGLSVQAWMRAKLFSEAPDTADGRTRRRSAWGDE